MNIKVELNSWSSFKFLNLFFKLGYYFLFNSMVFLICKEISEFLLSFDSFLDEDLSEYTWLTCTDCIIEHLSLLIDTFFFTTSFTKLLLMWLGLVFFLFFIVVLHSWKFSKILFFLKIFDNLHRLVQRFNFKIIIRYEV